MNLSKKQKSVLGIMATNAYKALIACGYHIDQISDWRHEQQLNVTGHASMTEMTQRDYVPMLNHYRALSGVSQIKDSTYSDNAKAIHRLRDIMSRHEITTSYLFAIVKDQYTDRLKGYQLDDLFDVLETKFTPNEIINLSYTINSRGRAKTKKINTNHRLKGDTYEPYIDPRSMPPGDMMNHFSATQI